MQNTITQMKCFDRRQSACKRIVMMRLSLIIPMMLAATLYVSAFTFGQSFSFNKKKMEVEQLLVELQKQTGSNIFYDETIIPVQAQMDVSYKNASVESVLYDLSEKYDLSFTAVNGNIVLSKRKESKKAAKLNTPSIVLEQQRAISGQVTDEAGEALANVTVQEVGTDNTTLTDNSGNFHLEVKQEGNPNLRFSLIGYHSIEQKIGSSNTVNAQLVLRIQEVDEIVVVGYGTQKKENLTGATTVVDSKLLESRPAANVSSLLQGTVPNLQVTFGSGRPGASGKFNIRGVNSISSDAAPLVIIDGFESDINRINPNDVESITVLKDASAAAVYGARASYGVILVTTKTGSAGRAQINYSGQASMSASTVSTDFETRGYYSARINDLFFDKYAGSNYTLYTDDDYYEMWLRRNDKTEHPDRPWVVVDKRDGQDSYVYYGNTDWYNYLFDMKRPMNSHNLSINGVAENIRYSLSGNYFNQKGVFRQNKDDLNRYNLRSRVDFKVNDWLDINTNLSYFNSNYAYPGRSGIDNTFNSSVVHGLASITPTNPDGTFVYQTAISNYNVMDGYAAMLGQDLHRNMDKISEFSPTIEAVITPFEGFDIRSSYRFIHYNYQTMNKSANIEYSKYPGEILAITSGIGTNQLNESQINHQYQAVNMYATYQRTFNENHDFKAMAGYNYETRYIKDIRASRTGLLSDQLIDFNLATGDVMDIGGGQNEYALFGTFYRFNYGYKDKYLIEAAGRYDGTSRFAKGSRYGFFPSFSAAWRMEKEDFFINWDQNTLNDFKIRLSYGSLGNQQVGYYDYLQTINAGYLSSKYSFGDDRVPYANESDPNSSALTWETVNTTNLGLDIGMLSSRLTFTGDIYSRETLNMLTAGKKSLPIMAPVFLKRMLLIY